MFDQEWQQEKIERILQSAKVIPFGISYLDDALGGILPNDLMLVGARSGVGKTEFATMLAANAAAKGKNVTFFALEADQWEIQKRMKYRKLAQFFHENYGGGTMQFPRYRDWLLLNPGAEWMALEKIAEAELVRETASLNIVYKGDRYSAHQFADELSGIDSDLVVVDHLHYFDFDGPETEGLKKAIHAIRGAAIYCGKPIVLVAHLRKRTGGNRIEKTIPDLDDFHGHSDIVKVSTTVLMLARSDKHELVGSYPTYFHIAKARTASEVTPFVGVMGYDPKRNSYAERYVLEKSSLFEDPTTIETASGIPKWAKRAMPPAPNPMATRATRSRRDIDDE